MNILNEKYFIRKFFRNSELICWLSGLLIVAISDPCYSHYTLCIFKLAGFPYCPGCGLGHSLGFLVRGEFAASFNAHPLGMPALFFIFLRIYRLIFNKSLITFKRLSYGLNVHDPSQS